MKQRSIPGSRTPNKRSGEPLGAAEVGDPGYIVVFHAGLDRAPPPMPMTLAQLADRIGAALEGDGSRTVAGCAPIERAGPEDLTFLANPKYRAHLAETKAAAVVVDRDTPCPDHLARLVADDPYFAFRNAMIALHGFRAHPIPMDAPEPETPDAPRVSAAARVHPTAVLGNRAALHPFAVVESGAVIGEDTVLYPGVYVGRDARVGDGCQLFPNVAVYDRCILGHRVTLHAGTVIGSDGFGYATHQGAHHKIPQAGIVVIEDDVEMGAACAVERAAMGETRIGTGTKFADLISIGHGTRVGRHCLFVSLVGVSGSVEMGDYVVLGGQVGIAGHLRIGHGVQAAARTAIAQDVPDGLKVGGAPARPFDEFKRNVLASTDLYGLTKRVRQLERELERLRAERSDSQK